MREHSDQKAGRSDKRNPESSRRAERFGGCFNWPARRYGITFAGVGLCGRGRHQHDRTGVLPPPPLTLLPRRPGRQWDCARSLSADRADSDNPPLFPVNNPDWGNRSFLSPVSGKCALSPSPSDHFHAHKPSFSSANPERDRGSTRSRRNRMTCPRLVGQGEAF